MKKDTLVKYQFNTTDKDGNKVMDKMSKEETMKAMNEISAQYGGNVIEEQSDKYVEEKVKNQQLDNAFADIKTNSKSAFLESLRAFQISNPNFLSSVLKKELVLQFWKN